MTSNKLALHLMIVFRRAERTISSYEGDVIKAHGLTPMQFGVLDVLNTKGPLTIGEIIEKMLATSGNMTVVIRNMERDGYVKRCAGSDKRSYLISLTEKGKKKIDEVMPLHAEHINEVFSIFSEEEQKELISLLRRFKDINIEHYRGEE